MAGMVQGKAVDVGFVMQRVGAALSQLPDARRGKNRHYSMADAGLSAFSVFFMQCPSFLEYQRRMQQTQGRNPPCQTICRSPKLWISHTEATPHEKKPPLQRV